MAAPLPKPPGREKFFRIRKEVKIVPNASKGVRFMTYNILTQTQISTKKSPPQGRALPWSLRFEGFTREIKSYRPDILCMQELDSQYLSDWEKLLQQEGMEFRYACSPNRPFGLLTAWRSTLWQLKKEQVILYDNEKIANAPRQCVTESAGQLLLLSPVDRDRTLTFSKDMLIANTHLFWHPGAHYERCRQLILLFRGISEVQESSGVGRVLLAGDMNTPDVSPPYQMLHGNAGSAVVQKDLLKSVRLSNFGKKPSLIPADVDYAACIAGLLNTFADLGMSAYSLGGRYYRNVDGDNTDSDGEPLYTIWSKAFRMTIDYLMVVERNSSVDEEKLVVYSMLRLPRAGEFGPQPNALPRFGYYPSDHLAVLVEIGWE